VVDEHQVLICPACHPSVLPDLSRCARCGGAHLIRRLDQVECLDCRLTRNAAETLGPETLGPETVRLSGISGSKSEPDIPDISVISLSPSRSSAGDPVLAAEVARALERVLGTR
jgi:hypothetical protein